MDVDAIQHQLARIADEIAQIKHFLREQVEERATQRQHAQSGVPANVAYISSRWPRRDGDKLVKAPELKNGA